MIKLDDSKFTTESINKLLNYPITSSIDVKLLEGAVGKNSDKE